MFLGPTFLLLVCCLWLFNSRHRFSQTGLVQTKHVPLRKPVYRQTLRQEVGWGMRVSPTGPEINGCAAKWRKERPQMSHYKEAHSVCVWNISQGVCDHERTATACVCVFSSITVHVQACVSLCVCGWWLGKGEGGGVTGGRYAMSWLTRVLLCCSVLHDWPSAVRGQPPLIPHPRNANTPCHACPHMRDALADARIVQGHTRP